MIERMYTESVDIQRMALHIDGESTELAVIGTIAGHVQQSRPEFAEQLGEAWGKVFQLWCSVTADIEVGDTLTLAAGSYVGTYSVSGIQKNAVGRNQHLECALVKDVT